MLLTSSQVSFAISSVIVFFFTSALFLSGYVLQQQTVRDLRAAIKPQLVRLPSGSDLFSPPKLRDDGFLIDAVVIGNERRKAVGQQNAQAGRERLLHDAKGKRDDVDMVGATRWQKAARRKEMMEEEAMNNQKPILEDEDSRRAKEASKSSKQPTKEEKPLSRAARRKQIKDQILAEGEGEDVKGYRLRLWG